MQRERERAAAPAPATRSSVATETIDRIVAELPTARHREVLTLLHASSHEDRAGRRVCWWPQGKLAAKLGISVRTLRNVLADLREPGLDPRHPRGRPPGLRLGLVKVEATTYTDRASGRHRLGGNLYVLLWPGQQATGQQATPQTPVSAGHVNRQRPPVACLNENTLSLEGEGGHSRVPTVGNGHGRAVSATDQENSDIGSTVGAATDSTDSDLSPGLRRYLEWLRAEHPEYFPSLRRPA
jgi:hypothetical protein